MTFKRFRLWFAALVMTLLSGCAGGLQSETIIIPSTEDIHTVDEGSRPFQVKTIYRLPEYITDQAELLGWASAESVIRLVYETRASDRGKLNMQRLSPPYDRPDTLFEMELNKFPHTLSPNGKYISAISKSNEGVSLKLIAYPSGEEENLEATSTSNQQLWFEEPTWSDNSQFISYLVLDSKNRETGIGIYDKELDKAQVYRLKGHETEGFPTKAIISDDGRMALIVMDQYSQGLSVALGTVNSSGIDVQYEHEIGSDQIAWLNNDQFVFLGAEGILYEYDRRNHELSILLEKIDSFAFSMDRKFVAYSQNGEDTLYAGKLQGKNILNAEPIYHGIIPSEMSWSPDHNRLLVHGRKTYSKQQGPKVVESLDHQPFIIEFE
ncbi:hypothetical protein [Paenibacillus sp. ISL-20]|uniref:hypothetical protein n=1 Tax=Paenibacillus sp. ISL-20 TaxID=2819163 RepID=UPI001BE51651|nr:hypothetical protein [Paenibacillus sp. ISL-20]MBT2762115.1 hypothetical protein [Paenibacillus sp. ISL-20]